MRGLHLLRPVTALVFAILAVACGSSGAPTSPTTSSSGAPSNFVITTQSVSMAANTVSFSWSGTGPFKMQIGSTTGASDLLNVDVTGTTYTWTGVRTSNLLYARVVAVSGGSTAASTELPLFTLDMRHMIDALYFGAGPLSEVPNANPTPVNDLLQAWIWPDSAAVNVLVTAESGDVALANARQFTSDYLAAAGNPFSAAVSVTPQTYKGAALSSLPLNTVVVRVDQVCTTTGVIACANYGPPSGASFVNMNSVGSAVSIAHEIGHAFGLHHMVMTSSGRPEFRFLMNPALVITYLNDVEKAAIAAARAGGLRNNMTRTQALALGLVLPYNGTASIGRTALLSAPDRDIISGPSVFGR